MPGGVSSARLMSMSTSGYMRIFRKIVGAHSLPKFFEILLTPTKNWFNPDFRMPLCLG